MSWRKLATVGPRPSKPKSWHSSPAFELAIRRRVKAEIDAKRRVIGEAKAAEEQRQAEIRRKALDRLKVEGWATQLERANRLRNLADKFETEKLASTDVIDAEWIRRAADWVDPTVGDRAELLLVQRNRCND
jgi:hypothetical protein